MSKEDMELEQLHACPACGRTRFRRYKRMAEWRIVQCHRCRLAFVNPRPSTTEQKRIYSIYEGYPPLPTDPIEQRRLIDIEDYRLAPLTEVRLRWRLSMETQRRIFSGTNLTMYARTDRTRFDDRSTT